MNEKKQHITSIGGQAVLEGVMMREPDESQLEVAIASLKAVLPAEGEDDRW